ncbi:MULTISPECIES: restriction endonuclease [unclassified Bradyrhizobium]|uniref:restriction endonuclease n=1 Tax=unclassified Bradyrhizobium TaxID=2631580 RepID=UPI00247A05B6|nr:MULTISPECIES: restriction endonuclease [unclassified Bradyrhizobium]WGS19274.1 restriction endonuclease [Bradyrhizobium sp. ISRA463]WGS26108.1 restriction endonuclease [Bradyrhizobium sp. ISRA464]
MFDVITEGIRKWLVARFASAIRHTTRAEDRVAALRWLSESRAVIGSDLSPTEKFKELNSLVNSRAAIVAIAKNLSTAVSDYRNSDLPLSMKIALPITLSAIPLVGGQAAGVAAFGGAVGVPVLLLIFLGTAGITSIIEAVAANPQARPHIAEIIDAIVQDDRLRRTSAQMKAAMREQPMDPTRFAVPPEELALRAYLLGMDPFHFERHTMSFFDAAGFEAWATRASNDFGVDGFAIHPDGLIIVQCKRNSSAKRVGRPTIQQFKGVIEEQDALRGYLVSTSTFTEEARESAGLSEKIVLVDIEELVRWHAEAPTFL